MLTLDTRGIISAAQIGIYTPIAIISLYFVYRYHLSRDAGWIFLFIFSLTRMAQGALLVAGELVQPPNTDLFLSAYILQPSGLTPLFLSTLGFLGLVGLHSYSDDRRTTILFRSLGVLSLIALGVTIAGGLLGSHVAPHLGNAGLILRRIGAGIYCAMYILLLLVHVGCWMYRYHLKYYRRKLLAGMTLALPFLGIRIAYVILAAWSASDLFGTQPSPNQIFRRFNPITGDWILYLVLSLLPELIVVVIYLFSSTVLSRRHH